MEAPIIFCHYGNNDYLTHTLKCARFTNPNKRIILLGDSSNVKTATENKVEHFFSNHFPFQRKFFYLIKFISTLLVLTMVKRLGQSLYLRDGSTFMLF